MAITVDSQPALTVLYEEHFEPQPQRLTFTGSGSEYFRIWIVNLLLCIITLGLYSAWAKVRKARYFYENTQLCDISFEYHGNALAILRGRVIALLFLAACNIALKISAAATVLMLLVVCALLPWMIWKSLQFKLFNSSYRGIRFGFEGSPAVVYYTYLVLPILTVFSLYLLTPVTHQRIKKFQHAQSRYGAARFSFHATPGAFYKVYALGAATLLVVFLLLFLAFSTFKNGFLKAGNIEAITAMPGALLLFLVTLYASALLIAPVFLASIQNLVWNNTALGNHRFSSGMKAGKTTWVAVTNLLAIVCTLGLFIPFAQVRIMKYRVESIAMLAAGSLDNFVARTYADVRATGESMSDLLDFDLSF